MVLLRGGTELTSWPLPGGATSGLGAVDEVARLHLAARRLGCAIVLRAAAAELCELLELAGLGALVGAAADDA